MTVAGAGMDVAWEDRRRILIPLLCLVLAAAFRLYGLGDRSLWYDEGYSWLLTSGDGIVAAVRAIYGHIGSERTQPLYFLILVPWRALVGESEAALRLFSAACGCLTVAIVARAALASFGARAGWIAGVSAATSMFAIQYSQEARPYALLMLLHAGVLANVLLDHCEAGRRRRRRVLYCALLSAGLSAGSLLSLAPLAGIALADRLLKRGVGDWLRFWLPVAALAAFAAAAAYGPLLLGPGLGVGQEGVAPKARNFLLNIVFVGYGVLVSQFYGPTLGDLRGGDVWLALSGHAPALATLGTTVLVLIVVLARALGPAEPGAPWLVRGRFVVVATGLSVAVGAGMAAAAGFNWLPRHAFYLAPALWLALGIAVRGAGRRAGAAALALLALNLHAYRHYRFDPGHSLDDYRGVAALLGDGSHDGRPALLLWGNPALLRDYYGARHLVDGRHITPAELSTALRDPFGGAGPERVLVLNRAFYWFGGARIEDAVEPCCTIIRRTRLPYFEVLVVRLRDGAG